jgi:hypothetical protein
MVEQLAFEPLDVGSPESVKRGDRTALVKIGHGNGHSHPLRGRVKRTTAAMGRAAQRRIDLRLVRLVSLALGREDKRSNSNRPDGTEQVPSPQANPEDSPARRDRTDPGAASESGGFAS